MEKLNVKDSRIYSLVVLYDLHTTFFSKALDGISDADAHKRLNTKANHIAWIAGSLLHERYELAKIFGKEMKHTGDELFKGHQGIKDNATYPALAEYEKDWNTISPVLRDALMNVGEEKLNTKFEMMPGEVMSYYELLSFMIYREANCIGQIALWRRLLGYEAMKYD